MEHKAKKLRFCNALVQRNEEFVIRGEPLLPFAVFTDRTFTVMTLVLLAMGFAMVGVFLPMTIYYQSVLGLSAVAAGLVIGTQSRGDDVHLRHRRRAVRVRQDQHEVGAVRRVAAVRRRHGLRDRGGGAGFRAVGVRARVPSTKPNCSCAER